jgi:hypothetical protein
MSDQNINTLKLDQSIEQLENDYWTDTNFPTGLIERCFKYRKIPLRHLTIEQLRTLISQNIGLGFLLPAALEILRSNILAEGDYFPGDLLSAVLAVNEWSDMRLKLDFKNLLKEGRNYIQSIDQAKEHNQLVKQIDKFLEP